MFTKLVIQQRRCVTLEMFRFYNVLCSADAVPKWYLNEFSKTITQHAVLLRSSGTLLYVFDPHIDAKVTDI